MVGALPPMDANIRGIFYDWITNKHLWRHQGALQRQIAKNGFNFKSVSEALSLPIVKAMSKRPAPDLVYRTATRKSTLGTGKNSVPVNKGDTVILCLAAATQHLLNTNATPNVDVVFGGKRKGHQQPKGAPKHACPAYKMAMGSTIGIVAALLNSGKLKGLPASLILEIRDWERVTGNPIQLDQYSFQGLHEYLQQN